MSRNLRQKIREKFKKVSCDENYDHEFFQFFKMNYLPKKGKKRKLKTSPLLIQYSGYRVINLAKTFLGQVLSNR